MKSQTKEFLNGGILDASCSDACRAPIHIADYMAKNGTLDKAGYAELTANLKWAINDLSSLQKGCKSEARANTISRLIQIRRASKGWSASSYDGDPLMLGLRRRLALASEKVVQKKASGLARLSQQEVVLSAFAADALQQATDAERRARDLMRKARKAQQGAARLKANLDRMSLEVRTASSQRDRDAKSFQDAKDLAEKTPHA